MLSLVRSNCNALLYWNGLPYCKHESQNGLNYCRNRDIEIKQVEDALRVEHLSEIYVLANIGNWQDNFGSAR